MKRCLLLLLLLSISCARGKPDEPKQYNKDDYAYTKQYATWLIQQKMKKQKIVGMSIALIDDQALIWSEGFGFADQEKKAKATADTLYRAGSVSKLFTATAAMQLVEQGKLDIDQPLVNYLPGFSVKSRFADAPPITPRMLMTHHSGLFGDFFRGMITPKPAPFINIVEEIKEEHVAYPPNFILGYSNTAVTLLGCTIETIAQKPFAEHLKESILTPLGMKDSSFEYGPPSGTMAYQNGKPVTELAIRDMPAGGLNTSVNDLSRFMMMILAKGKAGEQQLIQPETLSQMLSVQNQDIALDTGTKVGLAWFIDAVDVPGATRSVMHDGATLYHRAMLVVLPEQKLGVVILSNSAESGSVEREVAQEVLRLAIAAKAGAKPPESSKPKKSPASAPSSPNYEGTYATAAGEMKIEKKRGRYRADVIGQRIKLIPNEDNTLKARLKLLKLIPIPLPFTLTLQEPQGREVLLLKTGKEIELLGERIAAMPSTSKTWKARFGEYKAINAGDDFMFIESLVLREEEGSLLLEQKVKDEKRNPAFLLQVVNDNEAILLGLGRHLGETVRVVSNNGKEALSFSGYLWQRK
jgi:CubicO group peptidase (beta-lactamase class C family)